MTKFPQAVVSGGQSGVDRAALDVALALGLPCGGWCPKGRWAEDGPIDARYPLRETSTPRPSRRTACNLRDSDATLVLLAGPAKGGTLTTMRLARLIGRPCLVVGLDRSPLPLRRTRHWLAAKRPRILNIAGPRESEAPGIYVAAAAFLLRLLPQAASASSAGR